MNAVAAAEETEVRHHMQYEYLRNHLARLQRKVDPESTPAHLVKTSYAISNRYLCHERHAFLELVDGQIVQRFMTGLSHHLAATDLYAYDDELMLSTPYVINEHCRVLDVTWMSITLHRLGPRPSSVERPLALRVMRDIDPGPAT